MEGSLLVANYLQRASPPVSVQVIREPPTTTNSDQNTDDQQRYFNSAVVNCPKVIDSKLGLGA